MIEGLPIIWAGNREKTLCLKFRKTSASRYDKRRGTSGW